MDVVGFDRAACDPLLDARDVVGSQSVEVHGAARDLSAEDEQIDIAHERLCLVRIVL
jgi:hypothetical protein